MIYKTIKSKQKVGDLVREKDEFVMNLIRNSGPKLLKSRLRQSGSTGVLTTGTNLMTNVLRFRKTLRSINLDS